ncbi:MAG: transglutaminase-like domain-containing protein [Oscillospiraceae bacterium]|nr:transglutaminase-like domain-containing protein [Oscillospiraceae bacterium]
MNIRNSGKIPDMIRKLAAVAALSMTLWMGCGCVPSESYEESSAGDSSDISEPIAITSEDNSTHIPTESSGSSSPGGIGDNESSDSSGGDSYDPDVSSDSSETDNSVSDSETSSKSEASSSAESSDNSSQAVSQVVSSTTSEPVSVPDPPKPPVVVVPDVAIPTSPGTLCAVAATGAIDYSNVSQGYISARYSGSVSKVKLLVEFPGKDSYSVDMPKDQSTVYIPLTYGNGEYTVSICELASGTRYTKVVKCTFTANMSSALSPFLYPNVYSDYDKNSSCVYKAAEVCAGKSGTIDKIAAVFGWITSNVVYDHNLAATVQKGYVPDPERTYNSRKGICFDYASLMCAMLRSQSIPTRLVIGYASPDIWHAWNEIYTEETGWITPELMLKKAGYNIADSTFYASASDKSKIASYISNSSNYQAVYYY